MNNFERAALVVPDEVFHIFQNKCRRLVIVENVGNGEKEVALLYVLESMLTPKAVFLGDAREAERLAGKTAAQNIELGNVGHSHGMNIAVRFLAKIRLVGLLTELVPVAGENALRACSLESDAKAANTAEEVNEAQG